MEKLRSSVCFAVIMGLLLTVGASAGAWAGEFDAVPVDGMVTMIDLGAKKCIPCKMMAPILEKMKKIYKGKAEIVFIDVWENPEEVKRFKIRAIPTQIFFDKDGKEVYRHLGFMSEKKIVGQLAKMGVDSSRSNNKSASSADQKKDNGKTTDEQ